MGEKITTEQLLNRKIFKGLDLNKMTDNQMKELNNVLEVYNTKTIKNRLVNIRDFIKYGVEDNWLGRIDIIRNKLKNDVTSDYALEIRYGKNNVEKIKSKFKDKYGITKERYVSKYGEIEGSKKWGEYLVKSKTPWGLDSCIQKYGEIDGPKKWEERLNKKVKTMSERKKIKPYRNGRTLIEYQERYGLGDGYKRWKRRNDKHSYRFSKEYYIKEFGEVDGLKKWGEYVKSMDKTSLNAYQQRYGEELGFIKHKNFSNRMSYINTLEYYQERYGNDLGIIKYNQLLESKVASWDLGYSKVSQELFWSIYNKVSGDTNNIYFGELNDEYIIYTHQEWGKLIKLDFKYKNKIIEFDGDYWHSKPEQIKKDKLRDEFLLSKGYEILRIKESEFRNTPLLILEKCVNFIKK
jgi:hypothetical protein